MPAATLRMKAARSNNRCEGTSASAGSSRSVRAKSLDTRMGGKDTGGLAPAGSYTSPTEAITCCQRWVWVPPTPSSTG